LVQRRPPMPFVSLLRRGFKVNPAIWMGEQAAKVTSKRNF
jgi:hypothetical protein